MHASELHGHRWVHTMLDQHDACRSVLTLGWADIWICLYASRVAADIHWQSARSLKQLWVRCKVSYSLSALPFPVVFLIDVSILAHIAAYPASQPHASQPLCSVELWCYLHLPGFSFMLSHTHLRILLICWLPPSAHLHGMGAVRCLSSIPAFACQEFSHVNV